MKTFRKTQIALLNYVTSSDISSRMAGKPTSVKIKNFKTKKTKQNKTKQKPQTHETINPSHLWKFLKPIYSNTKQMLGHCFKIKKTVPVFLYEANISLSFAGIPESHHLLQ